MSNAVTTEIITPAEDTAALLKSRAEAINERIHIITGHESAFEDATLEHRLCIGLELAHAKAAFGLTKAEAGAIGGSMSPGDMLVSKSPNHLGFTTWLAREVPAFKRSKADLYINAFNALGLTRDEANPKLIREKLRSLNHRADKDGASRPTLKSLYKLGKPQKPEDPLNLENTKDSAQLRLEDAREAFHTWKEDFEQMVTAGQLDDLDTPGLQSLKEFLAGARDRVNKRLR